MRDIKILKEDLMNLSFENKTLNESQILSNVYLNENETVVVTLNINKDHKLLENLKKEIIKIVKIKHEFSGIKFEIIELGKAKKEPCYILVESGKGGVGKSTVCVNLAYAFKNLGRKVGLIDADIYGASIPNIINKTDLSVSGTEDGKIYPLVYEGIEYISTSYFTEGQPLMWRGPLLGKMLGHFVNDTLWDDEIEYMFVDLPPGTGDVMIDLKNLLPNSHVLIVTTPNHNASDIAIKAGLGAINMEQEILGVVENMSYYINPLNNEKDYIFGLNGGREVANKLNTRFLGEIPLVKQSDKGIYESNSLAGRIYLELANNILNILTK